MNSLTSLKKHIQNRIQNDSLSSLQSKSFEFSSSHIIELLKNEETEKLEQYLDVNMNINLGEAERIGRFCFIKRASSIVNTHIVELFIARKCDVNMHDPENGQTALHVAVENECLKLVQTLIYHKADINAFDHDKMAPIHIAAELNNEAIMRELIAQENFKLNLQGPRGNTAIHLCIEQESFECLHLLLNHPNILICTKNNMGLYPVHVAIKKGSAQILDIIIKFVENHFMYTRAIVMNFKDPDENTPLHIAVNTGHVKCVKLCLDNEAEIDKTQNDGSTPFQYACVKGECELVEYMLERCPDKVETLLSMSDMNGYTSLHSATLYNHSKVVEFLIKKGADIEAKTELGFTPLLLAFTHSCLDVAKILIDNNANYMATDKDNRNILHLSIMANEGRLCGENCFNFPKQDLLELINQSDNFGYTPLHCATERGLVNSTNYFLSMGASYLKNIHEMTTPLHVAARFGRHKTCQQLLREHQGLRTLQLTDHLGQQPIHIASEFGNTKVVKLLLKKGCIFQRDYNGNTVLHLAVSRGHLETAQILINESASLLNTKNADGKTPLHLAAINNKPEMVSFLLSKNCEIVEDDEGFNFITHVIGLKHSEVAKEIINHDRWQEILTHEDKSGNSNMIGFIENMPDFCFDILDKSIKYENKVNSKEFKVEFNFNVLYPINGRDDAYKNNNQPDNYSGNNKSMQIIGKMVELKRITLLQHPICDEYIQMKWNGFGRWVQLVSLSIYTAFLICLTLISIDMNTCKGWMNVRHDMSYWCLLLATIIMCGVNILKDLLILFLEGFSSAKYDYALYASLWVCLPSLSYLIPMLFWPITAWQMSVAKFTIPFGYLFMLIYQMKYNFFGIYVVMFVKITESLLRTILVFSFLFIGFGMAFFINFRVSEPKNIFWNLYKPAKTWDYCGKNETINIPASIMAFKNPALAILRAILMTVGEFDYVNTFIVPRMMAVKNDYKITNDSGFYLLIVFIIVVSIVLMNLLIGLAVGDIEKVRADAELTKIEMQVSWLSNIERKLPIAIKKRIQKSKIIIFPNTGKICPSLAKKLSSFYYRRELASSLELNDKKLYELSRVNTKLNRVSKDIEGLANVMNSIVQKLQINTVMELPDEDNQDYASLNEQQAAKREPKLSKSVRAIMERNNNKKQTEKAVKCFKKLIKK